MKVYVNGIYIYYKVVGSGPPILLLHGNSQSHRIFDAAARQLRKAYTVYMPDTRDHGRSTRVGRLCYEDMEEDAAAFIRTVIHQKTVVYGLSDGGITAILLAADHPELLRCVIASGANTTPDGVTVRFQRIFRFLSRFYLSDKMKMLLTQPQISSQKLAAITVPVHIIAGSRDIVKENDTRYIAKSIPGATLEILRGERHTSYVTHSKKLCPLILKYIPD